MEFSDDTPFTHTFIGMYFREPGSDFGTLSGTSTDGTEEDGCYRTGRVYIFTRTSKSQDKPRMHSFGRDELPTRAMSGRCKCYGIMT